MRKLILLLLLCLGALTMVSAQCDEGKYGNDCEYDCETCDIHGECVEDECVCDDRWTGPECQECLPQFGGVDCSECAPCYRGDTCEIDCECLDHGRCIEGECACYFGFTGLDCSTPEDFNIVAHPAWVPGDTVK